MPEYERSIEVAVAPDAAFRYLAEPANLPEYVETMVSAEPAGTETLRVAAQVQGRREEGDARLRSNPETRRLEWSGEGERTYSGSLQVRQAGEGSSVTVHIHTASDEDEAEINRALDETMGNIGRLLEAGP